jgi:hypothetical protein
LNLEFSAPSNACRVGLGHLLDVISAVPVRFATIRWFETAFNPPTPDLIFV